MLKVKHFRSRLFQILLALMVGSLVFLVSMLFTPAISVAQEDSTRMGPVYPAGAWSEEQQDVAEAEARGPVDFRIVDLRSEYGQLIVEVEHFDRWGNFAYYELYTWQGREGNVHARATDTDGRLLLSDGTVAPMLVNLRGRAEPYLPPGTTWKRETTPQMAIDSILDVIEQTHIQRSRRGWDKGRQRLTVRPLDRNTRDDSGVFELMLKFAGLAGRSYLQPAAEGFNEVDYQGEGGPRDYPDEIAWGTISTFYPSMDGFGETYDGGGQNWAYYHDASSSGGFGTTSTNLGTVIRMDANPDKFDYWARPMFIFDTSALPDSDIISAATFGLVGDSANPKSNGFTSSVGLVIATPASNTALVVGDWDEWTPTLQATSLTVASLTIDDSTYNDWTLNATGRGNISTSGFTSYAALLSQDIDDSEPSWSSGNKSGVWFHSRNESAGGESRPRLVVTHSSPTAAITGTIGDGATEQEVRDGGGTIIITLTGTTWVADGATFNAQRQNIIDGLDAADAQTNGWNAQVRDQLGVSSVVRTSDTIATITVAAGDVGDYFIATNETITVTVPSTSVESGSAITATPTITITASTESAAVTGTIGDGATEQEVRDGGGTILVTLTNTNWVADGATFNAQRQNIIDGLDAADAQAAGWNAQVRDQLGVSSVVRTSNTLVTITVAAGDVTGYAIATSETITVTVPASAIRSSAIALTATPTITITAAAESVAMSGTLGGSGGVPSEIVAGGETIILTLTNTTWAVTADFNAQRQNILDGLVSDGADQNGWDSLAFAVSDVIRTSNIIVTITLTAEAAYAIPAAETISAVVPASAIVHSAALTAPQTFTITPGAFVTSGTRVSAAIDLQSITDLAYCAIGWETTLPANTTVTVETSVDGGATYSTPTNGSCPSGLTVGESLATITDFRVKATLTTTDTSVTPLITALGLIVEDAGGSELCYQLVTTPSASLADSCGTYTGTMSFPIGPSTITSSTDPITSTADPLPNARALAGQDVAQAVTGSATSAKLFPAAGDEGGFVGLPLNDLVNEMSTVGDGLPVRFVWFIFLGIATIGAGMLAIHLTSNLFIAAGAMAAVMGFQMAIGSTGLLPGWILFAFIPLAAAFLLFRRGFPI